MLILKGRTFPTTHFHIPSPRNTLTKSYQFQHYRSFSKSQQKHLLGQSSLHEHPLRVKIERDMHCQSWLFLEIRTKSTMPKNAFFSNGPNFLCLKQTPSLVHDPNTFPYIFGFIYLIYFYFNHLKIKLNQINDMKLMKTCFNLILKRITIQICCILPKYSCKLGKGGNIHIWKFFKI